VRSLRKRLCRRVKGWHTLATTTLSLDQLPGWCARKAAALSSPATLQPLFKQLQVLAVADTRDNFQTSSDPDGSPWAPLKYRQGKPLLDKGLLRASIQSAVTPAGLTLFTNRPGAAAHQWGAIVRLPEIRPRKAKALRWYHGGRPVFAKRAKAHSVRIPQRRFLGFGRRFLQRSEPVVGAFFDKIMGA
jgi:phage gpG-like protein